MANNSTRNTKQCLPTPCSGCGVDSEGGERERSDRAGERARKSREQKAKNTHLAYLHEWFRARAGSLARDNLRDYRVASKRAQQMRTSNPLAAPVDGLGQVEE